ncbi:OmpA family protein [Vibrio sp. 10N.222.55.A3]|uniref:OmpA family protein n=1 Tax=unclassified Vibrio TaxID=2614977 RepID=UPI001E3DB5FA|nr:OmpA family protein [Vibrio sp. F13]MCC4890706.1 OmpA family protein [Vibrio sp. F13]
MVKRYDIPGLYLMGRLHDRDGNPVGRLFPLAHETLVIPSLEVKQEFVADHSTTNKQISTSSKNPIAVSDELGKLNILAAREFNADQIGAELLRAPLAKGCVEAAINKGAVQDVLFFPSYLVPLSQMANVAREGKDQEPWLTKLYNLLSYKDLKEIKDDKGQPACVTDLSVKRVSVEQDCLAPPPDQVDKSSDFFNNYAKWYNKSHSKQIHVVEVPQFYTIQVVFSSVDFIGAEVTLADLPKGTNIQGSKKEDSGVLPTSKVKDVSYEYSTDGKATQQESMYVATFWLNSESVLSLSSQNTSLRINIDFSKKIDEDNGKQFVTILDAKGIPKSYSLKENALALDIHTTAGRTAVVNGDPISVEEALINHAPQFFPHLSADLEAFPYDSPEKLIERKETKTSLPNSTWATFQTVKGSLETTSGVLKDGISWVTLSKFAASATELFKDSEKAELRDVALVATKTLGATQASGAFIKAVADLNDHYPNEVTQSAHFMNGRINAQIVWFSQKFHAQMERVSPLWSTSILPYLTGAGRIGTKALDMLDKPLTIADLGYDAVNTYANWNGSQAAQGSAHGDLLSKIQEYMATTASIQADKAQAFQRTEEKYRNAVDILRNEMPDLFVEEGSISLDQRVEDVLLRLNMTFFEFDSYQVTEKGSVHKRIAEQLQGLISNPFEIVITGHTCNMGSEAYNLALSEKRAISVKEAILDAMSPDARSVWSPMFKIVAKGYAVSLPGNTNRTIEERVKNRRVEIYLAFSRSVEYPPCRAGLMNVEKAAKIKIAKDMNEDQAMLEFIQSGLNALIGGAAMAFPPAKVIAAGVEGVKLATAIMDLLKPNTEYQKCVKQVDSIRYQDLMAFNQFLAQPDIPNATRVYLKSYMKRMIALNGLIRLIKSFHAVNANPAFSGGGILSDADVLSGPNINQFSDLDVLGYIDEFILNDDWSVDISLLGAEHLDEVWMEKNGYRQTYNQIGSASVTKIYAQGVNVYRHYASDDLTDLVTERARRYNHYFPIHYRASQDDSHFEALLGDKPPTGLDDSIFERVEVFVRRPYKSNGSVPKYDDWVPFEQYFRDNGAMLTPYDNIKVVALVKDGVGSEDNSNVIGQLPICLDVISHSSNEGNWKWSDSVASTHIEYVSELSPVNFSEPERKVIFGDDNNAKKLGVIIQPSYFFGTTRVFGIRPVANYDDVALKSLFDTGASSTVSGGFKFLSYFFELKVPGQSKTEKRVNLLRSFGSTDSKERTIDRFSVTLSPSRQYELTKDFINFSGAIFGDGLFYEKTFLTPPEGKKARYPQVFDGAKVSLYLGQSGLKYASAQKGGDDPLLKADKRMSGKVTAFDWNKETTATLLIRSKPCDPDNLEEQGFDKNLIPIHVQFSYDPNLWPGSNLCPVTDFKAVARLGTVKKVGGSFIFEKSEMEKIPKSLSELQEDLAKMNSESLECIALSTWSGAREEETTLFASVEELSYINLFGHKVNGLRPMIAPSSSRKGVNFGIQVNAPFGSGLDLEKGEGMHLTDSGVTRIPTNWIKLKYKEDEVEAAKQLNKLNTDLAFAEQSKEIKFKPHINLQKWMSYKDHFDSLLEARIDMIDSWVEN